MKYLSAQRVTGTVSHWHEKVEGGCVLPLTRHTMAITTQLTLSIYTTVQTDTHGHTNSSVRSEKGCFPRLSIDPVILTATPVVGPVKLNMKNTWDVWCQLVAYLSTIPQGKFKWEEKEQNFNLERVGAINLNLFPFTQRLLLKLHWCNIKCYNLGEKMRWGYE